MSDSSAALRHQIASAKDLQSVVRTMRALAASRVGQYERAVLALAAYRRTVDQGLGACLRAESTASAMAPMPHRATAAAFGAVVFGSDEGLVGQFNEAVVDGLQRALAATPGPREVWVVGDRVRARLEDAGIAVTGVYPVPNAVEGIATLVDRLQLDTERRPGPPASARIDIFYNRPLPGALFEPVQQRLLPLDAAWQARLAAQPWPRAKLPDVMGGGNGTLRGLIREYLFISLFQACAESLASENASRLAAMQRADRNIDELLASLGARFHGQRQRSIDEELFDVTAGYVALRTAR